MREIKFRAWANGKMVSPDFINRDGSAWWKEDSIPVRSGIVMQFTGLHDKYGKEIYEGDIIKCIWLAELGITELDCEAIGQVVYQPAIAAYVVEFSNPFTWKSGEMFYEEEQMQLRDDSIEEAISFEVIGNIHENTELLK